MPIADKSFDDKVKDAQLQTEQRLAALPQIILTQQQIMDTLDWSPSTGVYIVNGKIYPYDHKDMIESVLGIADTSTIEPSLLDEIHLAGERICQLQMEAAQILLENTELSGEAKQQRLDEIQAEVEQISIAAKKVTER